MKIVKDNQLQLLQNLTGPSSAKATPGASQQTAQGSSTGTTDTVELSGWKNQVASLKAKVQAMPTIDEDKVAKVKQALDSGTYNANGQMVARSMLKSQFLDEIF